MTSLITTNTHPVIHEAREIERGDVIMSVSISGSEFELVEEEVYRRGESTPVDTRIALIRKVWNGTANVTAVAKHFPISDRDNAINEFVTLSQWAIAEMAVRKKSA
ncbi:hypothetical protein L9H26_18870 [Morganella psychrotolerans]|uniref:Uncharacterized protein n=1 Tax=Morganella psychrotolerans TaxID=368603 RepID=A0A5M9QY40_9GAMM|nr:hypothetical protein [Morganella psychrotolerans]KAA8712967.1 hypothetical protein F4V73_17770 [Morganella psychrotolerans]OBU01931.1 hypothetical protein AYY16_17135 [Morganella psychrotolerans]